LLTPIGTVESTLVDLDAAPRQGDDGAPDAWLVIAPDFAPAPPSTTFSWPIVDLEPVLDDER